MVPTVLEFFLWELMHNKFICNNNWGYYYYYKQANYYYRGYYYYYKGNYFSTIIIDLSIIIIDLKVEWYKFITYKLSNEYRKLVLNLGASPGEYMTLQRKILQNQKPVYKLMLNKWDEKFREQKLGIFLFCIVNRKKCPLRNYILIDIS